MSIITLTTDFGLKDPSAGAVKGAIYSEMPGAEVVDISHSISPFHITEASYIIKNAYKTFPRGTIHIIGVDSALTPENQHLVVQLDDYFFICADNGILSLIATVVKPEKIIKIDNTLFASSNFPERDVFAKVAVHLAKGGIPETIGIPLKELRCFKETDPVVNTDQNKIVGNVIYIDNFGNVITNIHKKLFRSVGKGRDFIISARSIKFSEIFPTYSSGINYNLEKEKREEVGKKLAVFNSSGLIELAVYKSNPGTVGSAATLFGLELRDTVTINFG